MNPDAKRIEALERRVAALEKLFQPQADPAMQPGEIPLKAWVMTEAQRCGVKPGSIYNRLNRGYYQELPVRRVSGRIRYVLT